MGNIGGNRNYGYGKQLAWAGKNALADRYGNGHYSTKATHEQRWNQFARYLKGKGINDARKITITVLEQYGTLLGMLVNGGEVRSSYAQNALSTVNVVLETMRKDKALSIKPAQFVGNRSNIRSTVPASYNRQALIQPSVQLRQNGQERIALIALLTRELGLRFKEACLLDTKKTLRQAQRLGRVTITQGTKGGRNRLHDPLSGNRSERSVPVENSQIEVLCEAAKVQGDSRNLIPSDKT